MITFFRYSMIIKICVGFATIRFYFSFQVSLSASLSDSCLILWLTFAYFLLYFFINSSYLIKKYIYLVSSKLYVNLARYYRFLNIYIDCVNWAFRIAKFTLFNLSVSKRYDIFIYDLYYTWQKCQFSCVSIVFSYSFSFCLFPSEIFLFLFLQYSLFCFFPSERFLYSFRACLSSFFIQFLVSFLLFIFIRRRERIKTSIHLTKDQLTHFYGALNV